jgi:hypothetical protein
MPETENLIADEAVKETLGLNDDEQAFVERLWKRYQPFAECGFAGRFSDPEQTQAMFWEMYLTCVLLQEGHNVKVLPAPKRGRRGPDALVEDLKDNGKRVWFEANAPGCGGMENNDKVPDYTGKFGCHGIPDSEITLRYTGALRNKREAYVRYQADGTIKPDDACVIAISAGSILHASKEAGLPRIIKAVLPFGAPIAHLDLENHRIVDETYEYRPYLQRSDGDAATTRFFEDQANSLISAVVFSYRNTWCRTPDLLGHDIICIHNPLAVVPIRRGFFSIGREFWIADGRLIGT